MRTEIETDRSKPRVYPRNTGNLRVIPNILKIMLYKTNFTPHWLISVRI